MGLEEHTIEELPERCQSCGAELTETEKSIALTEGSRTGVILCATCSAEVVALDEEEAGEHEA